MSRRVRLKANNINEYTTALKSNNCLLRLGDNDTSYRQKIIHLNVYIDVQSVSSSSNSAPRPPESAAPAPPAPGEAPGESQLRAEPEGPTVSSRLEIVVRPPDSTSPGHSGNYHSDKTNGRIRIYQKAYFSNCMRYYPPGE